MKKLLLTGVSLMATVLLSYGQSVFTATSYADNFNDNTVSATAEDGWYKDATLYTSIAEANQKLVITAANADKLFKGFGLYLKPATKIDISSNKKVSMHVTNPHPTQAIKLRVDVKLRDASFAGPNCPAAAGDTVNANMNVENSVVIPANTTQFVTFDYSGADGLNPAGYEYNTDPTCGPTWSPDVYDIPATAWADMVGLYMVVNGGATETWCTEDDVCDLYTGEVIIDNLMIGGTAGVEPTAINSALANINSSVIYPNPATENVTVTLDMKSAADVKVTLSDMMGREVAVIADEKTTSLVAPINVSTLTKGLYTVNYFINGAPAKAELLMVK